MTIASCKGCSGPCHAAYVKKCDGYCFECWNRGVPERDELREENARLKARIAELLKETNHAD